MLPEEPEEYIGNCATSMNWKAQTLWYEHTPADVVENDEVELYWGLAIQTNMPVAHNRPDIILVEQEIRKRTIIDIAVTCNVVRTED